MARSRKGSRGIKVDGVAYRWRATGSDMTVELAIWPDSGSGRSVHTRFSYGETVSPKGPGRWVSNGDQIVITTRIVERVIRYAISKHGYATTLDGPALELPFIEFEIDMDGVIRANG